MKFKVGDKVRSEQPGQEYTGTVSRIVEDYLYVDRSNRSWDWQCKILDNGDVATASGLWDNKSLLLKGGEKNMMSSKINLTDMQEASLDADTKTLVEEGIIDGGLDYSGSMVFSSFLLMKFKAEFAAHLREKRAAIEKEKKKKA